MNQLWTLQILKGRPDIGIIELCKRLRPYARNCVDYNFFPFIDRVFSSNYGYIIRPNGHFTEIS